MTTDSRQTAANPSNEIAGALHHIGPLNQDVRSLCLCGLLWSFRPLGPRIEEAVAVVFEPRTWVQSLHLLHQAAPNRILSNVAGAALQIISFLYILEVGRGPLCRRPQNSKALK